MAEFSLDRVVEILTARGVENAHVEQTGGGTATIFAGPTFEEPGYGTRYAACAGPGRYSTTPGVDHTADTEEFAVGPDDYGDGEVKYAEPGWTVEQVADAIAAQAATVPA